MADRTDWHPLAETVSLPTLAIIGGRKVPAVSGETFASVNPATGKVVAQVAACDGCDMAGVVAANVAAPVNPAVAFGGFRQANNGRDLLRHTVDKYTALRTTWIRYRR